MEWSWAGKNAHPRPERSACRVRRFRVRHVDGEPRRGIVEAAVERELDALELRLGGPVEVEVARLLPGERVEVRQTGGLGRGISD